MADFIVEGIIRARDAASDEVKKFKEELHKTQREADGLQKELDQMAAKSNVFSRLKAGWKEVSTQVTAVAASYLAIRSAIADVGRVVEGAFRPFLEAAEAADRLDELSLALGITVEDLSRFNYAATLNKADIESMQRSFRLLSRAAYDAHYGLAETLRAFNDLGIEVDDSSGQMRDIKDLFLDLADKISKTENNSLRLALAQKILGRSGGELVPLLAQGREAIEGLMAESDRLGITLSSAAAKTGAAVNDIRDQIKLQVTAIKVELLEAVGPIFVEYAKEVSEALASVIGSVREHREQIETAFNAIRDVIAGTIQFFSDLKLAVDLLTAPIGNLVDKLTVLETLLRQMPVTSLAFLATDLLEGARSAGELERKLRDVYDVQDELAGQSVFAAEASLRTRLMDIKALEQQWLRLRASLAGKQGTERSGILEQMRQTKVQLDAAEASADGLKATLATMRATGASGPKGVVEDLQALEEAATTAADIMASIDRREKYRLSLTAEIKVEGPSFEEIQKAKENLKQLGPLEAEIPLTLPEPELSGWQAALQMWSLTDDQIAAVTESVIDLGVAFGEAGNTAYEIGLGIAAAFEGAKVKLAEMADVSFNITDGISEGFANFANNVKDFTGQFAEALVVGGNRAKALGDFLVSLGKSIERLVIDIAAAILKALILKAVLGPITGGLSFALAGGGETRRAAASGVLTMAQGGEYPIQAATGVRVPGLPSRIDSIPSLLSPGEVVLPTLNGRSPSGIVSELADLSAQLKAIVRGNRPGEDGATTYVNINAFNVDALRDMLRHGDLNREQLRALDLGRA